ncbi:hypothetical protein T12_11930, partial [Trichinella patagoniensis]
LTFKVHLICKRLMAFYTANGMRRNRKTKVLRELYDTIISRHLEEVIRI